MELVGDTIKLESKNDIDTLQNALDLLIKSDKIKKSDVEEIKALNKKLDSLWYAW